jgi:hypothetical protein
MKTMVWLMLWGQNYHFSVLVIYLVIYLVDAVELV